jgi:hypothetical protein
VATRGPDTVSRGYRRHRVLATDKDPCPRTTKLTSSAASARPDSFVGLNPNPQYPSNPPPRYWVAPNSSTIPQNFVQIHQNCTSKWAFGGLTSPLHAILPADNASLFLGSGRFGFRKVHADPEWRWNPSCFVPN